MITFFVAGIPKASQTGSVVRLPGGRAFPTRRNTAWGDLVGLAAREFAPPRPLAGPLELELVYTFPRPKGVSPRKRAMPDVRPDAENLLKHQLDALNGVLWEDDAQIVDLRVRKIYGPLPGLTLSLSPYRPVGESAALTLAVAGTE
jgi:Holliday junction resolvase RusA-like endonuclease